MRGDHDNLGGSNRWLSLNSAAAHLDMPPERLRRYFKRWGIPAYRAGRELRFKERELNTWVAKQKIEASS